MGDAYQKKDKDTIQYTYIPLKATAVSSHNNKVTAVNTINIARFLLLKKTSSAKSLYLQTFVSTDTSKSQLTNFTNRQLIFANFTGSMTLKNLKSDKDLVYIFKNGQVQTLSNIGLGVRDKKSTNSFSCSYVTICDWNGICNGAFTVTSTSSPSSNTPYAFPCAYPNFSGACSTTSWTQVRSYVQVTCTTDTNYPIPPPLPNTGGGGGGGANGGESNNSSTPADSNLKKILYWCSNFTVDYRLPFKNAFYDAINDQLTGCFNTYVFLSFLNPAKPGMIAICLNPNANNNGGYDSQTKTLSYPNLFMAGDPGTLQHEFFHVFQDKFYAGGITQYSTGTQTGYSNIEFETALYNDLIRYPDTAPFAMTRGDNALKVEYENWIKQITNNGTALPTNYSQIQSKYFYFLNLWKQNYAGYNKPTDPNLKPEAMLNVFKNSSCK